VSIEEGLEMSLAKVCMERDALQSQVEQMDKALEIVLKGRTESDTCCVDIYNDLDEYEAKRNPRSIFLAWQRGRSIERPTKAAAPAEPILWPCPNPSLDGAYIDGQEIGPQVFAIGRLTWDSANKRWQCLADVGGALCMVEAKVRAQPESREGGR
jgi:hypothetical protein